MFGYTRPDSMTSVFFDLSLPTLDTAVHNSRMLFANQSLRSCNKQDCPVVFNYTCVLVFILSFYCMYISYCIGLAMDFCLK